MEVFFFTQFEFDLMFPVRRQASQTTQDHKNPHFSRSQAENRLKMFYCKLLYLHV